MFSEDTPDNLPNEIRKELAWEEEMVHRGAARFMSAQQQAKEGGRGDETSASRNMLKHYLVAVAGGISDYINQGKPSSDKDIMAAVPAETLAMMSLKVLLGDLHNPRKTLSSAAQDIGARLEDELLMQKFHATNATYFEEILRRIEDKQSYSREYKRKSIIGTFRAQGVEVEYWEPRQRYRIGQRCVQIAMEVCDLFKIETSKSKYSGGTFIRPTDETLEWIKNHDEAMSLIFPDRMPMLVPPEDWTSAEDGGYYSPHLRKMTPLIIKSPLAVANGNKWLQPYNDANMPEVYSAINALQRTPWTINTKVLEVLQHVMHNNLGIGVPPSQPLEFPTCPIPKDMQAKELQEGSELKAAFQEWKTSMRVIHEMEGERKAKLLGVLRVMRMANMMTQHDNFYFVYRADFRGRLYSATNGLSPQGTEIAKSMLKFKDGITLGERGWFWLRVAGANRYGKDKMGFEDRVAWIEENRQHWLSVAGDPIANRHIWSEADEPYQFLAWCFEYAEAIMVGPEKYRSHLVVGMDGSCNGLQHFSAMLRDPIGGKAVNLTRPETSKPADIYQWVGDVLTGKLQRAAPVDAAAANWLALLASKGLSGIPRSLPKPPVMTLPYGSTQQACTHSVYGWYMENGKGFFPRATAFKHALYLSPILWESIGEVVVAARAAMKWIRQCTSIVVKEGYPLLYTSPLGFPVRQKTEKRKSSELVTYLSGRLRVEISLPTGELDSIRMQNGSSPNFVHHCDATHEMMTINAMVEDSIRHFAMVHDEYGTHAANVDRMHSHIREQFHRLYTEFDPLTSFRDQLESYTGCKMPEMPTVGTLNIDEVLESKFFFS